MNGRTASRSGLRAGVRDLLRPHPLTRLTRLLGGTRRALLVWVGTPAVAFVQLDGRDPLLDLLLVGVVLVALLSASRWLRRGESDPSPVEEATARYMDGDLDLDGLDRELDLLLDERRQLLRDRCEDVSGIGPDTAREVALRYGCIEAVRVEDPEALSARVPNVGPKRARALREELS